jgi:alpha-D-ribose 1-methylphosphonate 5-triphosphate synthase subunit PhnH
MDLTIEGGFADLVLGAQSVFRAVMEALARPGSVQSIASDALPPAPLTPELGAVALTLCDHDTLVWLDPVLAANEAVTAWLAFHCGAPLTSDRRGGVRAGERHGAAAGARAVLGRAPTSIRIARQRWCWRRGRMTAP